MRKPVRKCRPQEQSKSEPCWDRDQYDRTWQDAVVNAAIAKETASDEPIEKAAGSRKKEWPIHLPIPEPILDSPEYCFRDAAKATAHRTAEPDAVPIKPDAEATTTSIPAAKAPEFGFAKDNRHRNTHRTIRSLGLYAKALELTGIVRRQFRHLASLLTGRTSDAEREAKRSSTAADGGSPAKPSLKYALPIEAYAVVDFICETLDWMNPWHQNTDFTWDSEEDYQQIEHDPFYPHP